MVGLAQLVAQEEQEGQEVIFVSVKWDVAVTVEMEVWADPVDMEPVDKAAPLMAL